jgi:hypothetical protein
MKKLMGQLSSHVNGSLCSTDAWHIPQVGQSTGKCNRLEDGLRCSARLTGLAFSISQAENAVETLPGICLEHGSATPHVPSPSSPPLQRS